MQQDNVGSEPDSPIQPSDDELLAYLDGALSRGRATEVDLLIRQSIAAQRRLGELEEASALSAEISVTSISAGFPSVEEGWRDLKSRIEREESGDTAVETALVLPRHHRSNSRPRPWAIAAACLLSLGTAAYWLGRASLTRVLAESVISRTISADQNAMAHTETPVIHQHLTAKRTGDSDTENWDLWNRPDRSQFSETIQAGQHNSAASENIVGDLRAMLDGNGIDVRRPLYAGAYSGWRHANHVGDDVKPVRTGDGRMAFAITSVAGISHGNGSLLSAEFTVRTADWHTVEAHLRVQSDASVKEYDLQETAYEVLALNAVPVSIFAPAKEARTVLPSPLPVTSASLPSPPVVGEPPPTPETPHVRLAASAIEVQYLLHKLGACTQEQMTASTTEDGQLVVHGVVRDQARLNEIQAAMATLDTQPRLDVSVLPAYVPLAPAVTDQEKSGAMERVLPDADQALIDATAVYMLGQESYVRDVNSLPAHARALLDVMVRDHLERAVKSLGNVQIVLGLPTMATPALGLQWPEGTATILVDVRTLNTAIHKLASPASSAASDQMALDMARTVLARLTATLAAPKALTAMWFTDRPPDAINSVHLRTPSR